MWSTHPSEDNWVATRLKMSTLLDLMEYNANILSRFTAICQSVAEVQLTGVAPLGAVSHRFIFLINLII